MSTKALSINLDDKGQNTQMMFAHRYILLRDTPTHPAGRTVRWHGANQRFYFYKLSTWGYNQGQEDIHVDFEGPSYTVAQVQDTTWFEPRGDLVPFIPPFPSRKDLDEFVYLMPECRLVDDVDVCRAFNTMLADPGFQLRLYAFYRDQYNQFWLKGTSMSNPKGQIDETAGMDYWSDEERSLLVNRIIARIAELQLPPHDGVRLQNLCPRHKVEALPEPTVQVCVQCEKERK